MVHWGMVVASGDGGASPQTITDLMTFNSTDVQYVGTYYWCQILPPGEVNMLHTCYEAKVAVCDGWQLCSISCMIMHAAEGIWV